ncbi:hypothetical protein PYW07_004072 [Mythimna separata]|uniref:RING-type domain-containing protein n=1 Tax=Mythimna separata TaxID=271217 RepID=A0AAD8DTP1_MYTSE|nr:hypothetical protein PYW07_004072 [Mythimna separata]
MKIYITYKTTQYLYEGMTPEIPQVKEKTKKTKKQKTKAKSKRKQFLRIRCPICFNNLGKESVVSTRCGHVFCRNCLQKALLLKPVCPTCRRKLTGYQGYHKLYLDENVYEDFMDEVTIDQ